MLLVFETYSYGTYIKWFKIKNAYLSVFLFKLWWIRSTGKICSLKTFSVLTSKLKLTHTLTVILKMSSQPTKKWMRKTDCNQFIKNKEMINQVKCFREVYKKDDDCARVIIKVVINAFGKFNKSSSWRKPDYWERISFEARKLDNWVKNNCFKSFSNTVDD